MQKCDVKILCDFVSMRISRKWSLRQAAMYLKISPQFLSSIERRKEKPSKLVLYKMSYLLVTRNQQSQYSKL